MSRTFTSKPAYVRNPSRGRGNNQPGRETSGISSSPTHVPPANRDRTNQTVPTIHNSTGSRGRGSQTPRGRGTNMYGNNNQNGYGRGRGYAGNTPPGRALGGASGGANNGLYDRQQGPVAPPDRSGDLPEEGQNGRPSQVERTERRDAYTVIKPDMAKRDSIQAKAQQETTSYQQYKKSHTPQHVSYTGTVGGGHVTQTDARKKTVQDHRMAQFNSNQKAQNYKEKEKQREEEELNKKKMTQRQKAEENKRREEQRQQKLQADDKNKKEAWLQSLEAQNRQAKSQKVLSSTAAKHYMAETQNSDEDDTYPEENYPEQSGNDHHGYSPERPTRHSPGGATRYSPGGATDSLLPLEQLVRLYPHYDREVLENILLQCNGKIHQARQLLS